GARGVLLMGALAALLLAALENPRARMQAGPEQLTMVRQASAERIVQLEAQYNQVRSQIAAIEQDDRRIRALVVDPSNGKFAPMRQSEPDEPMLISQIVRLVRANDLSWSGKLGVYLSRWWE